jgi:uncharacterized CHY-type Zn-finger protein
LCEKKSKNNMTTCYHCHKDVGEPDIGDWSSGGTPIGIGMVVCAACLRIVNEKAIKRIEKESAEDAKHQFSIKYGGVTIQCDDRDDTPADLE